LLSYTSLWISTTALRKHQHHLFYLTYLFHLTLSIKMDNTNSFLDDNMSVTATQSCNDTAVSDLLAEIYGHNHDNPVFNMDDLDGFNDFAFPDTNTSGSLQDTSSAPIFDFGFAENLPGNSFDSDFSSDNNLFEDLSSDIDFSAATSMEPREGSQGGELASSPTSQGSGDLQAFSDFPSLASEDIVDLTGISDGSLALPSDTVDPQASPSASSIGPVESMWSSSYHEIPANMADRSDVDTVGPMMQDMGYNPTAFAFPNNMTSSLAATAPVHMDPTPNTPPTSRKTTGGARAAKAKKTPPKPRAPCKPAAPKGKPGARVTKSKAKATPHKRTTSTPVERTLRELYNLPWMELTHPEKARLLLPLLQGIDPNTSLHTGVAGSLAAPPPDYEFIGADMTGMGGNGIFGNMGMGGFGSFNIPAPQIPVPSADYGAVRQRQALERGPHR
jgi:hypothetical protein